MQIRRVIFAGLFALTAFMPASAQETNGAFGAYLVGTFEQGRAGFGTIYELINPTLEEFEVVGAFYDFNGNFLTCEVVELKPNDKQEVVVWWLPKVTAEHGVFKAISFRGGKDAYVPVAGMVGFERHCNLKLGCSESNLAAVPMEVAKDELNKIVGECSKL
jgi:hypothetical protein